MSVSNLSYFLVLKGWKIYNGISFSQLQHKLIRVITEKILHKVLKDEENNFGRFPKLVLYVKNIREELLQSINRSSYYRNHLLLIFRLDTTLKNISYTVKSLYVP